MFVFLPSGVQRLIVSLEHSSAMPRAPGSSFHPGILSTLAFNPLPVSSWLLIPAAAPDLMSKFQSGRLRTGHAGLSPSEAFLLCSGRDALSRIFYPHPHLHYPEVCPVVCHSCKGSWTAACSRLGVFLLSLKAGFGEYRRRDAVVGQAINSAC